MEPGFFRSTQFLVAGVVAALILGAAAASYQVGSIPASRGWHDGCELSALAGTPLDAEPETQVEDDGERRVVVYRLPADTYTAGELDVCSSFGEIVVDPSLDDVVEVRFVISSPYPEAVEESEVAAQMRADGERLVVGAWIPRVGQAGNAWGELSAAIRLEVRVPDIGAWDVRARSGAGAIHASDVVARELDLESAFGDVVVGGVHLGGNATLVTRAGDVILALPSVQSGTIVADSRFGDLDLQLPARADVGYDVVGETKFGEVTIRIGPTEAYDSSGQAGERETARSAGYDEKPTKVSVTASSSAGDIRIVTAEDG